jgi:hypothetical protein
MRKEWWVNYTVQAKPGETEEREHCRKKGGPFTTDKAAEQFLIQVAGRVPLLNSTIESKEIE